MKNISAPIKLNLVRKLFFPPGTNPADWHPFMMVSSQHSPCCGEITNYNEIAASVLSNRCKLMAQVGKLSTLNLICVLNKKVEIFFITFNIILKIRGSSYQADD